MLDGQEGVAGSGVWCRGLVPGVRHLAPSYVRTAFHKVRHNAKDAVRSSSRSTGRAERSPTSSRRSRTTSRSWPAPRWTSSTSSARSPAIQDNLASEKKAMLALREGLETGDFRLAGPAWPLHRGRDQERPRPPARPLPQRRPDPQGEGGDPEGQAEGGRRRAKQLTEMAAQKQALLTKLDGIEARLKMIEATRATNEFNFDDSALARAKQSRRRPGEAARGPGPQVPRWKASSPTRASPSPSSRAATSSRRSTRSSGPRRHEHDQRYAQGQEPLIGRRTPRATAALLATDGPAPARGRPVDCLDLVGLAGF